MIDAQSVGIMSVIIQVLFRVRVLEWTFNIPINFFHVIFLQFMTFFSPIEYFTKTLYPSAAAAPSFRTCLKRGLALDYMRW